MTLTRLSHQISCNFDKENEKDKIGNGFVTFYHDLLLIFFKRYGGKYLNILLILGDYLEFDLRLIEYNYIYIV